MADGGEMRVVTDPKTGDLILERPAAPAVVTGREHDQGPAFFKNLAPSIPENRLNVIGNMVTEQITYDDSGRGEWEDLAAENIRLLGTGPESKPDDFEYENSDTSDHPLMLTALTRFQSKALSALLPHPEQICRTKTAMDMDLIEDPTEREQAQLAADAAGRRVEKFYADYLLNQHPSYVEDTDQLLYECGLQGAGVRKVYNDLTRSRMKTRVERVRLQDLIVSYDTTSWRAGRITHRIDTTTPELIRCIRSGYYHASMNIADQTVQKPDPVTQAQDRIQGLTSAYMSGGGSHRIYESHLDLFLDEDEHPDGLARPYIVTVHRETQSILSIQRNWHPGDDEEQRIERFVAYIFHPGTSAVHSLGLGALLSNITRALRRAQRRALDAAYLANHPSGFKLTGFRIRDDATRIRPGEFVDVEGSVQDIRAALMIQPFEGPNQGLLALAEKMENNGRELGGIASIDFSQLMKAGIAAGPAMAAYEESTEFQTAIHRRLYDGQATEFRLIHERMREAVGQSVVNFGTNGVLKPGDLMQVDIVPFMKPGQASRQKQILEAQALYELARENPDVYDKRMAAENFGRALGNPEIDAFILPDPAENPPEAMDPVSEYVAILAGRPVRAAPQQDHQAHIDAHAAQMRGLQNSQLPVEQGEMAMASLSAHIAEHMGLDLLVQVAAKTGVPIEQMGANMPPELEAQLAPTIAAAVLELENQRAAAQKEDPNAGKAAIEQVKQQGAVAQLTMKQRHEKEMADLKHKQALELQAQKDEAAMDREEADNETAYDIALLKGTAPASDAGAKSFASAGAGAKVAAKA